MNGHLATPGDVTALMHTERVIIALGLLPEPDAGRAIRGPQQSVRLAIRALAWVSRWQNPAPAEEVSTSLSAVQRFAFEDDLWHTSLVVLAGDRSRDGPVG